jgi:site-specific DNA recombinase
MVANTITTTKTVKTATGPRRRTRAAQAKMRAAVAAGPGKAIGYLRVSTAHQVATGLGLDDQRTVVTKTAEAGGHDLVAVFSDDGVSGCKSARPGLDAAIDATIAAGPGSVLIARDLSRISRGGAAHVLAVVQQLEDAGCGLICPSSGINTTGPCGRMVVTMLAAIDEMTAQIIRENTKSALEARRASGRKTGGSVPYGFMATPDGHLIEHEHEHEGLRLARHLRAEGRSLRAIGAALIEAGYRPRRAATWSPKVLADLVADVPCEHCD